MGESSQIRSALYTAAQRAKPRPVAFELTVPHRLDLGDARARLHALGDYLSNKYGLTVTWTGDDDATVTGSYLVVSVSGGLHLTSQAVSFSGKDPGMLWRGKARDYLTSKLEKYLNPATSVDALPRR
jgi:hypothetical protein